MSVIGSPGRSLTNIILLCFHQHRRMFLHFTILFFLLPCRLDLALPQLDQSRWRLWVVMVSWVLRSCIFIPAGGGFNSRGQRPRKKGRQRTDPARVNCSSGKLKQDAHEGESTLAGSEAVHPTLPGAMPPATLWIPCGDRARAASRCVFRRAALWSNWGRASFDMSL